jgi:cobaltochelatase CobN
VDDAMWKETFDVYVRDKYKLGMKAFFDSASPFAYQDMTARMVETIRKGYWKADTATETKLIEEYVSSVQEHGVGCSEVTCGNARLLEYVLDRGKELNVPAPALEQFRKAMEAQIRKSIPAAARAAEEFVKRNEARYTNAANASPGPQTNRAPGQSAPGGAKAELHGFLMEQQQKATQAMSQGRVLVRDTSWDFLWVAIPLLVALFAWRARWHGRWAPRAAAR